MTRKKAQSASPEWSGGLRTPETSRTPPFGFRVPRQNASVHAVPWSSGECRLTPVLHRPVELAARSGHYFSYSIAATIQFNQRHQFMAIDTAQVQYGTCFK